MVFTNRNYFKFVSPLDRLDDKPGVDSMRREGGKSGVNIVKLQIVWINQLFDPKFGRGSDI